MSNRSRTPRSLMQKINKKNHKNSVQVPPRHLRRGKVESFHPPYRLACLSASGSGSKEKILCEMNILGKEQTHYAAINFTSYCVAVYRRSLTAENVIDKWIRKQKKNFLRTFFNAICEKLKCLQALESTSKLLLPKILPWRKYRRSYCSLSAIVIQNRFLVLRNNRDLPGTVVLTDNRLSLFLVYKLAKIADKVTSLALHTSKFVCSSWAVKWGSPTRSKTPRKMVSVQVFLLFLATIFMMATADPISSSYESKASTDAPSASDSYDDYYNYYSDYFGKYNRPWFYFENLLNFFRAGCDYYYYYDDMSVSSGPSA